MEYYKICGHLGFSKESLSFEAVNEEVVKAFSGQIYFFYEADIKIAKGSFKVASVKDLLCKTEDLSTLNIYGDRFEEVPQWIKEAIEDGRVKGINVSHPKFEQAFEGFTTERKRVHLLGLGDVGGTLLTGLRLMGAETIDSIGIYDLSSERLARWEMEANQIVMPNGDFLPRVEIIDESELFNCDMFVFTASKFVPQVGESVKDVRMIQLEANAKIIGIYGNMARKADFKGIFAVVSDPVDHLCRALYDASNTNDSGDFDGLGLMAEQIRGYGLGVMHGRALYYSKKHGMKYSNEGRPFGPHGKELVIAESIENYNDEKSKALTEMVVTANLAVRAAGFKPYIAPALSSGAMSLIATLKGDWHYSCNMIGGVYFGARNRLTDCGLEFEKVKIEEPLMKRLATSYKELSL